MLYLWQETSMKILKWGFPVLVRWDWLINLATKFNGFKITGVEWIPFVTVVDVDKPDIQLLTHETIHTWQQLETLIILYYPLYVLFYLANRTMGFNHEVAYQLIPFEQEAYENQNNKDYIKTRKLWAWCK